MRIFVLVFAVLATACTSQIISTEEHIQQYIGSDVTDVQERYLTETITPYQFLGVSKTMLGVKPRGR